MDSAPELNMTPQETVDALDRYIIGQTDAKKAVAGMQKIRVPENRKSAKM